MKRLTSRPLVPTVCSLVISLGAFAPLASGQLDPSLVEEVEVSAATLPENVLFTPQPTFFSPTGWRRLVNPNVSVAAILNRFDIDGDGLPDNAPDSDGDGLPDNWEVNGDEPTGVDRVVFFPAPSPVVPGTPPTPIFTRLAVATNAFDPDTDNDGLTDFIEVFGLMFIDEDRDGLLERTRPDIEDRDGDGDTTELLPFEWEDKNGDGMPSPGEYPIDDSFEGFNLLHDFDGFVFTDPTNPDTDGDGVLDGADNDPLINPRSFGSSALFFPKFNLAGDKDADNDGLGNGMDMGNDLLSSDAPGVVDAQLVDNPENIRDLIELFRQDLFENGRNALPESVSEDLLGADWDGNGLWRTTDVRNWRIIIDEAELTDPDDPSSADMPPDEFFRLDPDDPSVQFYATQTRDDIESLLASPDYDRYGGRGIGLGWQELLKPSGTSIFLPDPRVWAVLYSWRMPGFDIDGDGFVGVPNQSSSPQIINDPQFTPDPGNPEGFDDRIQVAGTPSTSSSNTDLDGQINPPDGFPALSCGGVGMLMFAFTAFWLGLGKLVRFVRRSRIGG